MPLTWSYLSRSREWQARPAKVVELRNKAEETGGRLIVFVPAGQHLAAEDSFGRSTFEVLDVSDLHTDVTERLRRQLQALAPDLVERAEDVIAVVRRDERFRRRRSGSRCLLGQHSRTPIGRRHGGGTFRARASPRCGVGDRGQLRRPDTTHEEPSADGDADGPPPLPSTASTA